jgi:methanogenic corrinoid protein MtbC1
MDTPDVHEEKRHPIQVAANRSGLSQDVLRAWEKRYAVVEPGRSGGGQRLYSDADVERLRLLRLVVDGGRRISDVSDMETEELARIAVEDRVESATTQALPVVDPVALVDCIDAIERLDAVRLEEILHRQLFAAGSQNLIEGLVAPLMVEVGRRWHEGQLLAAHEHLATGVLQGLVARILADAQPREPKGVLVVATTEGQAHEVGGLMAAAMAAQSAWRVVYLGAQLPSEEIVAAVKQVGADALALSYAYVNSDADDLGHIRTILQSLPPRVLRLVGGAAAAQNQPVLTEFGAQVVNDLSSFREALENDQD